MDLAISLFIQFLVHIIFLFFDEWGLYLILVYMYFKKIDYRLFLLVMFYCVACIISSYQNIHQIEASLLKLDGYN